MIEFVKRLEKGSALTYEEMDGNFERITLELNARPTLADSSISIINAILNIKDNVVLEGNTLAKLYQLILELNTNKINKTAIVNSLTSIDNTSVLSANQGKNLKDSLTIEITNRINSIFSESTRAITAENILRSDLTKETADRILEDNILTTRVNNLLTNIDSTALNSLSELVTAFQSADSNLTNALNTLSANANVSLTAETTRALVAEGILQTAITNEAIARIEALNQEEVLRISEAALKVNITDIIDSLDSNATNLPLSANQGRLINNNLNSLIAGVNNDVNIQLTVLSDRVTQETINRNDAILQAMTLLENRLYSI